MEHPADLLVVDDEPEMCELLVEYFGRQGYGVRQARDVSAARSEITRQVPGLAILDVHMPGEDGLSLARWLRGAHPHVGIVMLTAAAETVDRIVGLEVGADDYLAKPFDPRELLARVKSVLRRTQPASAALRPERPVLARASRFVRFGQCMLDLDEHRLSSPEGCDLALSAGEFDLLALFARSPNRPLTRDQIMERAHHRSWEVFDRSIDLRIMRLRRKIERNPAKPEVIKTVRNVGYVFVSQAAVCS